MRENAKEELRMGEKAGVMTQTTSQILSGVLSSLLEGLLGHIEVRTKRRASGLALVHRPGPPAAWNLALADLGAKRAVEEQQDRLLVRGQPRLREHPMLRPSSFRNHLFSERSILAFGFARNQRLTDLPLRGFWNALRWCCVKVPSRWMWITSE